MTKSASNDSKPKTKKIHKSSKPVLALLLAPTYWPIAFFEWVVAWIFTRRWFPLVAISPLWIGMAYLGTSSLQGGRISSIDIARRYLTLASNAKDLEDDKALGVYYGRLLSTPLENQIRYDVAQFLLKRERLVEAREQFHLLAPEEKIGFGPAHLWMIRELMSKGDSMNPLLLKQIQHHSQAALKTLPDDADSLWFAAQLAANQNELELACSYLELAAKKRPDFQIPLAKLYGKLGKNEQMANTIKQADNYFANLLAKDARDTQARLGLCQCKLWTLQTEEAIRLAEEGFRFQPESKEMSNLVIASHLLASDTLLSQKKTAMAIASLQRILSLDPSNIPALERIASLASKSPENDWANLKKSLEDALASGIAMPTVHFMLADGHLQRGEKEKAQMHLELALKDNPNMFTVLNNLAWIEANRPEPNLERAMLLIEQAIQIAPNHPEVLETKGDILLKSGKWIEVIQCLEPLLRIFPDRAELRRKMGESYSNLGDSSLADKFLSEAESIEIRVRKANENKENKK